MHTLGAVQFVGIELCWLLVVSLTDVLSDIACTQVFPNADTGFVLSYSVIMLNTDAHNPNIKPERRMTKEGFISNNRGIAAGQDLPREVLSNIYDAIVSRPITLKEDDKLREKQQVRCQWRLLCL
jgi:Sec7-like guanine-nucleotide exchange factor